MKKPSLKQRAATWISNKAPNTAEIKKAYLAMQSGIAEQKVQDVNDAEETQELLAEAYVATGGDIDDLLSSEPLVDEPRAVSQIPKAPYSFDSSPLIPDSTSQAIPLSEAEKRAVLADLKNKLAGIQLPA